MHIRLASYALVIVTVGCLIPAGNKVTSGYRPSKTALAFLAQPGPTREDVITDFGPPFVEYDSLRTLVYIWSETARYLHVRTSERSNDQEMFVYGDPEPIALFIAYDERGAITAYEERSIDTGSIVKECLDWQERRNR